MTGTDRLTEGFEGKFILHAPNVHVGGGAILLKALIAALKAENLTLLADGRMAIDEEDGAALTIRRYPPKPASRFQAEKDLRNIAGPGDIVLAFGNLPPIFRNSAKTVLFIQNRYLVDDDMPVDAFPLKSRLRILAERMWLKRRIQNADEIVVQTSTMAALVRKSLDRKAHVIPFDPLHALDADNNSQPDGDFEKRYDFVYVASGEPHKNHANLLGAWRLLAEDGIQPTLALTLSSERNQELVSKIDEIKRDSNARISNLGALSSDEVEKLYRQSSALIFPSFAESYGLPLLEASSLNMPILASELDYVRDLIEPVQTFDPRSARSIARAVKRHLQLPTEFDKRTSALGFARRICNLGTSS